MLRVRALVTCVLLLAITFVTAHAAHAAELTIDAPPSLAAAADRVRAVDLSQLATDLGRAGLVLPPRIAVSLIPDDDPRARDLPRWIVGLASGEQDVVIFPQRVLSYPYESVESVFRHEVAHLALSARAGGRPLPRWFHEGVAMSVDAGWGMSGQLRLLLEMVRSPDTADLARLFASQMEPDAAQAYGLSAALVSDLQRRHGASVPGAVAARVAEGASFADAFELQTGETPDSAAARAWAIYRQWTTWLPAITSGSSVWAVILVLAALAYVAQRRRRARRRRQWDEEGSLPGGADQAP